MRRGDPEPIPKNRPSSDCTLQLECMKLESLVIADQHAAVNTFPGLVHTARHAMGVGSTRKRCANRKEAAGHGRINDWGEVVTRQPQGNLRLDHLLSKEDRKQFPSLLNTKSEPASQGRPPPSTHPFPVMVIGETDPSWFCRFVCPKRASSSAGQSARLISVRSEVQILPGPPSRVIGSTP